MGKLFDGKIILAILFLVSFVLCGFNIFGYAIYILDEAKNTEAAREMLINGWSLVPTFNDELRTDKPPFHYFLMMLSYKLFGVNAFSARFFSAVFGALTITVTYYFIKKIDSHRIALTTVLILLSALFFVQEFHLAVPDPYLIFWISFSLFQFYNFYHFENQWSLFGFYTAVGFGVLTKGPIALLVPGMVIFFFLIFTKQFNFKKIWSFKPIQGLLWASLIFVPWFYYVHIETDGAWTQGFFLDHNINRFQSGKEGHGGLFIITWLFVLLGLMPFSFFIVQSFRHAIVNRAHQFLFYAVLVGICVIGFFSVASTKLPNYPMPCYPFVAYVIAQYLNTVYEKNRKHWSLSLSVILLLLISIALPIAGYIALGIEEQLASIKTVAFYLIPSAVGMLVSTYWYFKGDRLKYFKGVVGSWIFLMLMIFGMVFPKLTAMTPTEMAKPIIANKKVIVYKSLDPAFPINYQQTFTVLNEVSEIAEIIELDPTVIVMSNQRHADRDLKDLALKLKLKQKALFEAHTTFVWTTD